jgi:hypothetical protein
MGQTIDRRTVLAASLAGTAAVLLPGVATADDELAPVPGMLGDRRANEMWYQFDERAFYHPSQEIIDAYGVIGARVGGDNFVFGFRDRWLELSALPEYPRNYTAFVAPLKPQLTLLSRLELDSFDRFYAPSGPRFVEAFSFFGQGVLFDPRRADVQDEVHTMGDFPFYHGWHAYLRAMMFLNISCDRWARIDPVIAFAWAVQSTAKPSTRVVNPPLPRETIARLAASWLPRSPDRLDHDFRSTPYPVDL